VAQIKAALTVAPKYCLGWRQLGTIYSETNKLEQASHAFAQYVDACPDVPDAHLQSGKVLARLSRAQDARAEFERCATVKDEKDRPVAQECSRFLREMGSP
jgi:regulator of sirC expression with transglutaminase-like and TPR domain